MTDAEAVVSGEAEITGAVAAALEAVLATAARSGAAAFRYEEMPDGSVIEARAEPKGRPKLIPHASLITSRKGHFAGGSGPTI